MLRAHRSMHTHQGFCSPSASLILRPTADRRSTLLPELKRLASSSRGLESGLLFGGL